MFREWLHTTLTRMYPGHLFDVLVPPDASMGDYSVNLAFVLAKSEKKNPREVAQVVCDALMAEGPEMIERCEVAGPGFVNVYLKDAWLQSRLGQDGIEPMGEGHKVIVEYSSPNIAKPMHIGHLRSTIIGDALANIYEALGYEVTRWNFIGDWGTQFGKLIAAYKKWPQEVTTVNDLVALYVRANQELDEAEGQKEFQKLEGGDPENTELWRLFRKQSLLDFKKMYEQIGVAATMVVKGESDYEPRLKPLIAELEEKGIATESEGALIVDLTDQGLPPALLRKSDGATLYLTRDLASLEDRIEHYHPTKILYVVANQQALHFEQLFAVKDKLNLGPTETVHVKFGMVLGEDGKKLATREGKVIPLQEVIEKITALASEKNPETAHAIGIGALKYNDLRQHPYSDIVFDWDAMLDLGGNSGPYLQYTYARLSGIARKISAAGVADVTQLTHPTERMMLRHLLDFGYAVRQCAHLYTLNGLALYLYELATLANRYYEEVRIGEDDHAARQSARLQLVTTVAATLKRGLGLLGIEALERI